MSDDWCICINGKPIIFAFDNLSYVKMNPAIDDMMKSAWTGYPYAGAKEHYVLNIEQREEAMRVVKRLLTHPVSTHTPMLSTSDIPQGREF